MFASKFTSHIWVNKRKQAKLMYCYWHRNRMRVLTTTWRIICVV